MVQQRKKVWVNTNAHNGNFVLNDLGKRRTNGRWIKMCSEI